MASAPTRISFQKEGEQDNAPIAASLVTTDGKPVQQATAGVTWQSGRVTVDLNLSVVAVANARAVEVVWRFALESLDKSMKHTGDNQSGAGKEPGRFAKAKARLSGAQTPDASGEFVNLDFTRISSAIDTLMFFVSAEDQDASFSDVSGAKCVIKEPKSGITIGEFYIPIDGDSSEDTTLMAIAKRGADNVWKLYQKGHMVSASTEQDYKRLAVQFRNDLSSVPQVD
jgi:stress response protein SCP2